MFNYKKPSGWGVLGENVTGVILTIFWLGFGLYYNDDMVMIIGLIVLSSTAQNCANTYTRHKADWLEKQVALLQSKLKQ